MTEPMDYSTLSDDELMAMDAPVAPAMDFEEEPEEQVEQAPESVTEPVEDQSAPVAEEEAPVDEDVSEDVTSRTEGTTEEAPVETDPPSAETDEASQTPDPSVPSSDGEAPVTAPEAADTPADGTGQGDETPDYKAFYEQLTAPFKASKKEVQIRSPEEAIRLMQMGADYTHRMQVMKPNLQLMRMLQNNNLLDADKINRLIDLDQRKPEAIQALLHEAKIDPLDLNVDEAPQYVPDNHAVSDAEYDFHATLDDVMSTPEGVETVKHIGGTWDKASQEALGKEPKLLEIIHEQRKTGVYDRISSEVERQQMFGNLTGVPFIEAYKRVGDTLLAQQKQQAASAGATAPMVATPAPAPQTLETRPARSVAPQATAEQVRAASAPRTQNRPAKKLFNPVDMTDEEIEAMARPPR